MTALAALAALLLATLAGGPELLVSGYNSAALHRYDPDSGAYLGDFGPVPGAQSARYGPDGHLYVASELTDSVLRFDGSTGALLGAFVADDPLTPGDETGGLTAPTAAVFGADGHLYVASFDGDDVLRYDGATGAFLGVFVDAGDGGLDGPDAGMAFGPEGHLYVPSFNNDRILRYDAESGDYLDTWLDSSDGLSRPRSLRFRSDGWLYVTSWGNNRILRAAPDKSAVEVFATATRPTGLAFVPGSLDFFVTNDAASSVRRFDGLTGLPVQVLVPGPEDIIDAGTYLELLPNVEVFCGRMTPGIAGQANTIEIRNGPASSAVLFLAGFDPLSLLVTTCAPVYLGVLPVAVGVLPTDASGAALATPAVPPGLSGISARWQSYDPVQCRMSNLVEQTLE